MQKQHLKTILLNEVYKILLTPKGKRILHGGHNKEQIMLNVDTFKQTNLLTKEQFIYNSMQEVYRQHGLCRQTIRKYINSKKEYCGFLWEYI